MNFSSWFGGDICTEYFRFSKERLVEHDYNIELLMAEAAQRTSLPVFDAQPGVRIDPVLSVQQMRQVRGAKRNKTTVRYLEDHSEVDVDNDEDYPLRLLALTIKGWVGDWHVYRGRPSADLVKKLGVWETLELSERALVLKGLLVASDNKRLAKLVNQSSEPSRAELF